MRKEYKGSLFIICYVTSIILIVISFWLLNLSDKSFIYNLIISHRASINIDNSSINLVKYLWISILMLSLGIAFIPTILNINSKLNNKLKYIEIKRPYLLIIVISIIYCTIFISVSLFKYFDLQYHLQDLGSFTQVIWNTSQGRFFQNTVVTPNYLGTHFSLIALIISFIFKFVPSQVFLLLLQTIWLCLGVVPIYLITNEVLKSEKIAIVFSISYLMYAPLHNANLFEFHFETLVPLIILMVFYFLLKKEMVYFWIMIILLFIVKENQPLYSAGIGLYMTISNRKRSHGIILILISIIYFIMLIKLVMPFFGNGTIETWNRYAELVPNQGGLFEAIKNILLRPFDTLLLIFRLKKLFFILILLIPVCFLPFFSKKAIVLLITPFATSLLASVDGMYSIYTHNVSSVIPFIYITSILGLKDLEKSDIFNRYKNMVLYSILLFGLIVSYEFDYLKNLDLYLLKNKNEYSAFIFDLVNKKVPNEATVSVQNDLGAPFAKRVGYYYFPKINNADYIIINPLSTWYYINNKNKKVEVDELINDLLNKKMYIEKYNYNNTIIVLKRCQTL